MIINNLISLVFVSQRGDLINRFPPSPLTALIFSFLNVDTYRHGGRGGLLLRRYREPKRISSRLQRFVHARVVRDHEYRVVRTYDSRFTKKSDPYHFFFPFSAHFFYLFRSVKGVSCRCIVTAFCTLYKHINTW